MNTNTKTQAQVRAKIRWGIVGIFALLLIAGAYDMPAWANKGIEGINNTVHIGLPKLPEKNFNLGLDLQGGAHLIYGADVSKIDTKDQASAVEGVRDVIDRRINGLGVSEPNVQTTKIGDEYRVIVELPGVTDVKQAIAMIGGTPILEFKEQNTAPPRSLTEQEKKDLDAYNAAQNKKAEEAIAGLKAGKSFEDMAKQYSEDATSKNNGGYLNYVSALKYPTEVAWAVTQKEGAYTTKPQDTNGVLEVLKRGKERESTTEVEASHILICYLGAKNCTATLTKDEALQKAKDIYSKANASNFADLAKENSTEPGAKESGGKLGSFTKDMMIKPFADAVFAAKVGEIVGPVETEFGYHVIYKTGIPKEYELWGIFEKKKTTADIVPPQEQWVSTGLTGKQLKKAQVVTSQQSGAPQVSLQFDDEGKELFKNLTEKLVGQPIAIFLDGKNISSPTVQTPIRDGQAVITSDFNIKEAQLLAQRLNTGALPVPVELISQQTIGASLGADSLAKSLKAGTVALLIVMVFMLLYYRFPGFLSVIALSVYVAVALAIFKLIGATLTLAGIAGFILSIGMAVDANILIFERMKEELRLGKSLKAAVEEGFTRAWSSIRDGNASTFITAVILIGFGSSFVKGFAVTLIIGILVSMFSAITITRVMLRFVAPWFGENGNWLFLGARRKS